MNSNKKSKGGEKWMGNIYGFTGHSFDGGVYDSRCICPSLRACQCHGSVPYIVKEVKK